MNAEEARRNSARLRAEEQKEVDLEPVLQDIYAIIEKQSSTSVKINLNRMVSAKFPSLTEKARVYVTISVENALVAEGYKLYPPHSALAQIISWEK